MLSVHGQGGSEDMEPHAVDDLGHVASPVCFVHRLDLLLRENLLVHTALRVVSLVEESPRSVVVRAIELGGKDFVLMLVLWVNACLIWGLCSDNFLWLKWLQDRRTLGISFLFNDSIEKYYLIVVLRATHRS